jgi:hypothetical protein
MIADCDNFVKKKSAEDTYVGTLRNAQKSNVGMCV